MRHLLSTEQLSKTDIARLFARADELRKTPAAHMADLLKGKVLANVFYEPSTRTFASFASAMQRLGGGMIPLHDMTTTSSAVKGESLEDTMRVLQQLADVIVFRHPQTGSAAQAAEVLTIPLINAGDGAGQHPTQALLDLYTVQQELGHIEGLTITLLGDLKHSRTMQSLASLLARYKVRLRYVSPEKLSMPKKLLTSLAKQHAEQTEHRSLQDVIAETDVLYVNRVQKERFSDPLEYHAMQNAYLVDKAALRAAKPGLRLLNPLPRVGEIHTELDDEPGSAYWRQVENGLWLRMALLLDVLA